MDEPDRGVERLNHFVNRRLKMLRITRDELARRGGPHRSTLVRAIHSGRPITEGTLIRLDASLGWAPGTAAAILEGGTPATRLSSAQGFVCKTEHAHVRHVLHTLEGLLGDCRELVGELLAAPGVGDAR